MGLDGRSLKKDSGGCFLLTGASGMLGSAIGRALRDRGDRVLVLVRREPSAKGELRWNPDLGVNAVAAEDRRRLEGLDGVVHLSGANVSSKRWSEKYKREIVSSRVVSTKSIAAVLAGLEEPPRGLMSASAIGLYGDRANEILNEASPAGDGFFPEVCMEWERATEAAERGGIRVVHPRFGVVLGRKGGAMDRLAPLFRLGIGGRLGSGRQWMSWVDESDAARAVLFALDNEAISGPLNVVAPVAVTNAEFTRQLAHAVHRPALIPAPAFALRLAFGQMADEALLSSARAVPEKLMKAGFQFVSQTLAECFSKILSDG